MLWFAYANQSLVFAHALWPSDRSSINQREKDGTHRACCVMEPARANSLSGSGDLSRSLHSLARPISLSLRVPTGKLPPASVPPFLHRSRPLPSSLSLCSIPPSLSLSPHHTHLPLPPPLCRKASARPASLPLSLSPPQRGRPSLPSPSLAAPFLPEANRPGSLSLLLSLVSLGANLYHLPSPALGVPLVLCLRLSLCISPSAFVSLFAAISVVSTISSDAPLPLLPLSLPSTASYLQEVAAVSVALTVSGDAPLPPDSPAAAASVALTVWLRNFGRRTRGKRRWHGWEILAIGREEEDAGREEEMLALLGTTLT